MASAHVLKAPLDTLTALRSAQTPTHVHCFHALRTQIVLTNQHQLQLAHQVAPALATVKCSEVGKLVIAFARLAKFGTEKCVLILMRAKSLRAKAKMNLRFALINQPQQMAQQPEEVARAALDFSCLQASARLNHCLSQ